MKKIIFLFLLFIAFEADAQKHYTSGGKLKPEQAIMDVRHYTIALNVDFQQRSIDGYTTVDVIMAQPTHVLLFDLLDDLDVKQVLVNNKIQPFTQSCQELPAGRASVKVIYGGKPHVAVHPPWDDGFIWTTDSLGHPEMEITAEGTGGKLYFPCKDHPSDEPNEGVDMMITVPKKNGSCRPGVIEKRHQTWR
jgi:hypothetical protein